MKKNREKLIMFGKYLQKLRKNRGFTASSVAIASKITRHQLSEYENGKICMADDKFDRIADAMFLTSEERRNLFELYEPARAETYQNFSEASRKREEKKRKAKAPQASHKSCFAPALKVSE